MVETTAVVAGVRGIGRMRWFALWLLAFTGSWLAIVVLGGHWQTVVHHWGIAAAMAAGSYVAGSTPMGGGTVGFPVLVLLFDRPATLGRDFAFAIQSIGMTSASIFILCSGRPIERRILRWSMVGSLVATPPALAFLAPHVADLPAKLLFAVAWASFGMMHFVKLREVCAASGITRMSDRFDRVAGLVVGVLGGAVISSITGVGIDLLLYVVLVLLSRADLKIAIPTSVIVMAWTSLVGISSLALLSHADPGRWSLSPDLFGNWLAAAPVVALGAPLGAFVVQRIGRRPTLLFVSVLCVGQLGWTLWHERARLDAFTLLLALGGLLAFNAAFHLMYGAGRRLERRRGHAAEPG